MIDRWFIQSLAFPLRSACLFPNSVLAQLPKRLCVSNCLSCRVIIHLLEDLLTWFHLRIFDAEGTEFMFKRPREHNGTELRLCSSAVPQKDIFFNLCDSYKQHLGCSFKQHDDQQKFGNYLRDDEVSQKCFPES